MDVRIEMNKIVGHVAFIFLDPYSQFIAKLHAEGRVTDDELDTLQQEFNNVVENFGPRLEQRLAQDDDPSSNI